MPVYRATQLKKWGLTDRGWSRGRQIWSYEPDSHFVYRICFFEDNGQFVIDRCVRGDDRWDFFDGPFLTLPLAVERLPSTEDDNIEREGGIWKKLVIMFGIGELKPILNKWPEDPFWAPEVEDFLRNHNTRSFFRWEAYELCLR